MLASPSSCRLRRGSFSAEVIFTLFAFKALDPACMHLTRGNHETHNMNKLYGFTGEARTRRSRCRFLPAIRPDLNTPKPTCPAQIKAKYNATMAEVFREVFCALPLAICINSKVLVLHGGLFSNDEVSLDDIRQVDRFREPPEEVRRQDAWFLGKGMRDASVGRSLSSNQDLFRLALDLSRRV